MAKGSARADSGRMSYGSGKPVLGRKFCSDCGKWRHLCDYNVAKRTRGIAVSFSNVCRHCNRLRQRRHRQQPEVRERLREYDRIWKDAQRRRDGIPERNWKVGGPRDLSPTNGKDKLVDVKPFRDWLEGQLVAQEKNGGSLTELAKKAGYDEARLRMVRTTNKQVSVAMIDRVLTAANSPTNLWELAGD